MFGQPQPESLSHWLHTNAPAAWISAAVATTTLIATLKFRKRPKRLVVRELPSVSVLAVGPALRRRITMTVDGASIKDPRYVGYEIYNEGSEPIHDVTIEIALPAGTVVINANDRPGECPAKCEQGEPENLVKVSIPYVNPYREHRHLIHLLIFVDGETRPAKASGGGEGWSVRYSPLPGKKQMRKLFIIPTAIGMAVGAISATYLHYVGRVLRVGPPEIPAKALLAVAPLLALLLAAASFSRRVMRGMWSRAFIPQDRYDD